MKNGRPPKIYICKSSGEEMKTGDVRSHGTKCKGKKK